MTVQPLRVALGGLGLVVGALGVLALREATLSTHEPVDPATRLELVVRARTEGGEDDQSLHEMVEALLLTCRLEVVADIAGPIIDEGAGRFRATLEPNLDRTNRRQLRGCIEDFTIDHVRTDVVSFTDLRR